MQYIFTESQVETLQSAIDKWGTDKQIDMMIEECSELIKALCKYKRNKNANDVIRNIKEETADVIIMTKQMKMIFDSHDKDIEAIIYQKINRLKEKL
jgi:NTP pyrophosphatase (non-canonical NTP hydrolase)